MALSSDQVNLVLQTLRRSFPNWQGFDDAEFIAEEITYKRAAVEKAQSLLGQPRLQLLLDAGLYDEVIQALKTVGHSTNLLYLSIPTSSDLNILMREDLDKEAFAQAIFQLLWGEGDSAARLAQYLDYVMASGLPNKWTFPTYFLFLCHPEADLFIKPDAVIRPFLKLIGSELVLPEKPDAVAYTAILQLAQELKTALAEYVPHDMVDIQSLMWVCAKDNGQQAMNSNNPSEAKASLVIPPITPQTRFWKIAPGEQAHFWGQCHSEKFIAIGWPDLGDIRELTRQQFEQKRDRIVGNNAFYTPGGMEQVWKFSHDIKPGDRIVANRGFSEVVGIGVVMDSCQYEDGVHYRHRLPTLWYDTTPRRVQQGGWVRTLVELKREQFEAIMASPPLSQPKYWKFSPHAGLWDWERCQEEDVAAIGYGALGDVSELHPDEFKQRRDALVAQDASLNKNDLDAVWLFTQLLPGDQVVAVERHSGRVLGCGSVSEKYYYQDEEDEAEAQQCVPVEWRDAPEPDRDSTSRRKTVEEIDATTYAMLTGENIMTPEIATTNNLAPEIVTPEAEVVLPVVPRKRHPLNQILYGPPGTGKTYSTIRRAVEIVDGWASEKHADNVARFETLLDSGRIGFVTFHQSFSYEDFVEGIRPHLGDDGTAHYECRPGILKEMALAALGACLEVARPGEATFEDVWSAFVEKVENNPDWVLPGIATSQYKIVFTPNGNVSGENIKGHAQQPYNASLSKIEMVWDKLRDSSQKATHNVLMEIIGKGTHTNLIGAVVEELKRLKPQTTRLPHEKPSVEGVLAFLKGGSEYRLKPNREEWPPYVLVIDEINRGNISKILGELITLLEEDKRLGGDTQLKVTLPYSGDKFSLPQNLHLLGTMNTADKSLALVDVALRRRFKFQELAPDFSLCSGLNPEMRGALSELNARITLRKDREHRIGHAYFVRVHDEASFNDVFQYQVIPLLQEYFYNDWEGLRYVLGESKTNGSLIIPLPNSKSTEARNKWQWVFDAQSYNGAPLDALNILRGNYSMNLNTVTQVVGGDDLSSHND